jgi:uncharacterized membrane protein (DUF373 family)
LVNGWSAVPSRRRTFRRLDPNQPPTEGPFERRLRSRIARAFSVFEDVVYVGLGIMLAYTASALLVTSAQSLWHSILSGAPVSGLIELLDRGLLVLLIIELLYTVQVSFRAHALLPEPFLVVGLIAVTRRTLVLTAELPQLVSRSEEAFRHAAIEVALLTVMVVALVVSLRMLRSQAATNGGDNRRK